MSVVLSGTPSNLGTAGSLRVPSFCDAADPARLERFGELAEHCLLRLAAVAEQTLKLTDILSELAAFVEETRQLFDQARALRIFQNDPVVYGDIIEASACEAAIRLTEKVLAGMKTCKEDAGLLGKISTHNIRYLLAQVRQEIAKAAYVTRNGSPGMRQVSRSGSGNPRTTDEGPYVFRFDGVLWQVRFGAGTELRPFPDSVGMRDIHNLLGSRYEPLSALAVVRLRKPEVTNTRSIQEPDQEVSGVAEPQMALDDEALADIQNHLLKLGNEIEDAKESGNEATEERLTRERGEILKQLNKDRRRGGLLRRLDITPAEKARQTVRKAVTRAVQVLEQGGMTELVAHLRDAIDTGTDCVYRPGAGFPAWEL